MRKTGVLVIDNSIGITGAFKAIYSQTEALRESHVFHYCIPNGSTLLKYLRDRSKQVTLIPFLEIQKSFKVLFYFPVLISNSLKILRLVRQHKFQVIHVNDLYNMVGVILKLFRPGIKLVYHVRLLPSSYASALYQIWLLLILRYADAVICVSQAVSKSIPDSRKKMIIYDATPKVACKVKKDRSYTKFLYPGNFIPGKGHDHALRALTTAFPKIPNCQFTFIGGDLGKVKNRQYLKKVKNMASALRLQNNVEFLDGTEDLSPYYYEADVVVNFSESESFSMTCLESLFHGTPVIASKSGGPQEIVTNGVNGILVENRNLEEMAEALVTLHSDKELRKKMTLATVRIKEKFNIENSSKELKTLYDSLFL